MCSTSGKMILPILSQWYRSTIFASRVLHKNILLFDSFPMHKDLALIEGNRPHDFKFNVEYIPPGTTDRLQPLDNKLNRTFKEMVRALSGLYCTDTDYRIERKQIHNRDIICLIQLLMYNQCSSPRLKGWVQNSFYNCGYIVSYTPYIATPIGYCFYSDIQNSPCEDCEGDDGEWRAAGIRCGWCIRHFCAFHFFFNERYHYCERYIQEE